MGSLRYLGALGRRENNPSKTFEKGLLYVELTISGKQVQALLDTGATDNFLSNTLAQRLHLQIQPEKGKLKAVNSEAISTTRVTRDVEYKLGLWSGKIDFTVVMLDDFDVVLGL